MTTKEIISAFRSIASTLNKVKIEGEENLNMMLGTIRFANSIAYNLEHSAEDQEASDAENPTE